MGKTVFTNGCFDILHPGHIDLLTRAKALGSRLVVGINSDDSLRAIKGPDRPVMSQEDRKKILEALGIVDEVVIFDDLTPEKLIQSIKPDVLVKGGDWKVKEIIGADFVMANGGEVYSLPLLDGYSSSKVLEKVKGNDLKRNNHSSIGLGGSIHEHIAVMTELLENQSAEIARASDLLVSTFSSGSKVMICGNGGSAADAQHLAAEFVGRYELDRRSLPAIALTTDTSALTAISNDYGYDNVFERQVQGLSTKGDCLVAISTSGNSANIISAVMAARSLGCSVIGMTGKYGKKLASLCDVSILVPSGRTARIQEAHITIAHIWCEVIDQIFSTKLQTN